MTTYTSISDFLEANGFEAVGDSYVRKEDSAEYGEKFCIPYDEWQGLTVEAFIEKAKREGWVAAESSNNWVECECGWVGQESELVDTFCVPENELGFMEPACPQCRGFAWGPTEKRTRYVPSPAHRETAEELAKKRAELFRRSPKLRVHVDGEELRAELVDDPNPQRLLFSDERVASGTGELSDIINSVFSSFDTFNPFASLEPGIVEPLFSDEGVGRDHCAECPIYLNGQEVEILDSMPADPKSMTRPWMLRETREVHLPMAASKTEEEKMADEITQSVLGETVDDACDCQVEVTTEREVSVQVENSDTVDDVVKKLVDAFADKEREIRGR